MDVVNNDAPDTEMLLLMDQAVVQKGDAGNQPNYVQLASTYDTQQFVMQTNCEMDMESFDDLLTNQGISLENSELSVIEQDGQQYILLPNVSVAQVLQPGDVLSASDIITSNHVMTPSNIIASNNVLDSQSASEAVPSSQISILEPALVPQLAPISALASSQEQLKSAETQPPPSLKLSTEPVTTKSNNLMSIHRIVPSLCPNPIPGPVSPLSCQVCEFKADDELTLDTHMEEHRRNLGEKIYKGSKENSMKKSPRKGKRGRKKRNTCRFIRSVAPQGEAKKGPFPCSVCGVQIHMISVYKRHMKDHLAEKAYKCHVCSDSFNVKENLTLHLAIHSERGDNGYVCPACQRTFMRIASLKAHLAMHLQDETMICTECGDEFSLKSELDHHMEQHKRDLQLHLGEREDKDAESKNAKELRLCNDVDEIFTSDGYDGPYKEVMKKRNRKKAEPQRCMFCDKMFQKESQFKRHVLIHTGEKPFSCSTCGRSFNQSGALKIHMMMHSGSKPYTCPHCPQIYTQRGNLRVHLARVHSSVNRYPCVECSCVFKTLGSLNSHVTKYHKKVTDSVEVHFSAASNNVTRTNDIISDAMTLSSDVVTASENLTTSHDVIIDTSNGSRKDGMDVIQQLLHSLNDSDPKDVDTLEKSPSKQDIVRQALRDSGVKHTLEKAARIDDVEQHGLVEMQLHGDEDATLLQTSNHITVHPMLDSDSMEMLEADGGGNVELTNGQDFQTTEDNENATVLKELTDDANVTQQLTNGSLNNVTSFANSTDTSRPGHVSGVYMSMRTSGQDRTWRVRRINGVRWHQCMYCTKEFKKPSDLVRHIRVHTHERPYTCTTCMKSFAVKTSLTAHEKIHLGCKPYKCQVCSKSFSTSGSLKVHIRLHTGARPFKCPQCDLSFRTTSHRHNHLKSHIRGTAHKKLHKPRKDITCLLPRTPPVTLEKSIRLSDVGMPLPSSPDESTDDRAYVCTECGKSFKKWCHLKQHIRSHTGERPYTCIQCGKAFASSSILKAHMRVHTGHKPFHCAECNQSFASHHTLKRHMTIHSQSRPFMCPYCQKTFKTNGTCKKHIETHRNEVAQAMHNVTVAADSIQSTIDPSALLHLSSLEAGENISCENQLCDITTTASSDVTVAHNCVSTTDDVTTGMNINDDAMDFDSNPALAQIDPNIIQDLTQLDRFRDPIETNNFVTQFTTTVAADNTAGDVSDHVIQNTEDLNQIDELQDPLNFKCRGCSKLFESKHRLQLHEEFERSSVLLFPCSVCCHSMACEKSHISHLESHSINAIHHCPVCFVSFADIDGLNAHKHMHNSQQQTNDVQQSGAGPTQQSTKATKEVKRKRSGFYRLSEEQSEILEKTDPNQVMTLSERILLSAVAEKDVISFAQKPGTRGRFKEYETDGPIHPNVCQFCPKSFRKPSDLARHVRTHTGDKPFKCEICGKCFAIKSTMKCHEKRHIQKKMFRCHICDMMYSAKASLKVHMRLHTGTKPYKCPHCELTFRTSGHRKNHMATHTVQPDKSASTSTATETQTVHSVAISSCLETTPVVASSTDVMQSPAKQQPVLWSDMTLTLPMETFMNSDLFQESETLQLPMQLGTQGNITLQIDPMLIQPNLTDTSPATTSVANSQTGSWSSSNVVIQPVNQLCLQSVTSGGTSAEQSARLMPEIDISVSSSLTGVSNQILQSPSLSAPNEFNSSKQQESQFSVNPSILQAVQQLLGNLQNSNHRPQEGEQDLTFTLNASMPNPQPLHSVDQSNAQLLNDNQATSDNPNPTFSASQGDASSQ